MLYLFSFPKQVKTLTSPLHTTQKVVYKHVQMYDKHLFVFLM